MRNFYLSDRDTSKWGGLGKRFYVSFISPETGKRGNYQSVDALARKLGYPRDVHIEKRRDAELVCMLALEKGIVFAKKEFPIFADHVKAFWDYDGDRIQLKNKMRPNSIGRDYAILMGNAFAIHIAHRLPKNIRLDEVTSDHIRSIVYALVREGNISNSTIEKTIRAITIPLSEAYKEGKIQNDPTRGLPTLDTRGKERGVITTSELKSVIDILVKKGDRHILLAVMLSATTGMRQGEIRALKASNIEIINEHDALISVVESFAKADGFKVPKGKKGRIVPCPRKVGEALLELADDNPYDNGLVFWSYTSPTNPIAASFLLHGFVRALNESGVSEEDRKKRNVAFHSLRHYYVSYMRGKVPESMLRLTSGHESKAMSDRYTHLTYESVREIAEVARDIIHKDMGQ